MIRCKRVYEPASNADGYRVLVDRLWPRGVAKRDLPYDEWCKTLAPSTELRKALHSDAIDVAAFRKAYRDELQAQPEDVARLRAIAHRQTLNPALCGKIRAQPRDGAGRFSRGGVTHTRCRASSSRLWCWLLSGSRYSARTNAKPC